MNNNRKQEARKVRLSAADLAYNRAHPRHIANGDEQKFRNSDGSKPSYMASYTKGMPHDCETGLVLISDDFQKFVKGIDSGDPRDFMDVYLGPNQEAESSPNCDRPNCKKWRSDKANNVNAKVRAWESQGAGNTYDLEGPDAQAVTMPPAPALGSDELTAEIGEVYAQALLRDVPFTQFSCDSDIVKNSNEMVDNILNDLGELDWFSDEDCCNLTQEEASRKRDKPTRQTAFRGITPGDDVGPYISQFLLAGNGGINGKDAEPGRAPANGLVSYGALTIDQRVRLACPGVDYMTTWEEWLDVQEGADLRDLEMYTNADTCEGPARRFITTPRDMATYVHYDALYEAYLNACLLMLGKIPFDPGIPFQGSDQDDHQQGFAHFGGPHILSLVTEVATRALKAVRFQKFNVHRRLRPEVLAARFEKITVLKAAGLDVSDLEDMSGDLMEILTKVKNKTGNLLLPMAFCEGSPMHPSYGAGHATVAGACVTILKAFFDHKHPLALADASNAGRAFVARLDETTLDSHLEIVDVKEEVLVDVKGRWRRPPFGKHRPIKYKEKTVLQCRPAILTVEGELNKLASNIATGRDWAGVHYFTDYIESLRMGEQIAIGILEEQKLTYGENFSMTVPLFDGGSIRI